MELFSQVRSDLRQKFQSKVNSSLLALSCCSLCQQSLQTNTLLCQYCLEDLPVLRYPDTHFNLLHWPAINSLFHKKQFDQLVALSPYIWPLDSWLKQLKYQHKFQLAKGLAQVIVHHLANFFHSQRANNLIMTSVPTELSRWQQRGYNPAHLIAQSLAKVAKIQYQPDILRRVKANKSQVGKTGKQRRKDLKGAFELNKNSALPEHIVLFDDVITTGSTVNEICRLLKKQRVKHVTVLTLAIVLPE